MSTLAHKRFLSEMTPLTFYDGLKEAFSISRKELYLWDSYQDECEHWKIVDVAGQEDIFNRYLRGEIDLLDIYSVCNIQTARVYYNDDRLELIAVDNLFTPTPPKVGGKLTFPYYSEHTKNNTYSLPLSEEIPVYSTSGFIKLISRYNYLYKQSF
ncbi:hypothetical protein [Desulfovibrio sp.]|uniref:hypothetical protein n=1 Tax=Desulfovibrio sp. TaxID=885 RepID=UPI0035AD93AA